MFCRDCGRYVGPDHAQVTMTPSGVTRTLCRGCAIRDLQERSNLWFDPDKRHDEEEE